MVNIMGVVILGIIAVVFLGATIGDIADKLIGHNYNGTETNITGATSALAGLVPVVLVIVIMVGLLTASGLKITGKI